MDNVSNTLVCVLAVLEGFGGTLDWVSVVAKRDGCTFGRVSKATRRGLGSWGAARGGDVTFCGEPGGASLGSLKFLKILPSCVNVCKCC